MEQPLVCMITPVYNGEPFIREAIESVLAQTYTNWEYWIFNNCSTDGTEAILREYAGKDRRIHIVTSDRFLSAYDSLNASMRLTTADCKYVKPIHADDLLFAECVEQMVKLAEAHPEAGVIGAYGTNGKSVVWDGVIPYNENVVSGHWVCRQLLLGGPYIFGSPSSTMLRADLVRERPDFYHTLNTTPDMEACLELLQHSDFGFVHQVLTLIRLHERSVTSAAKQTDAYLFGRLVALWKYGPVYLSPEEYKARMDNWVLAYCKASFRFHLTGRGRTFRDFHRERMRKLGYVLNWTDVVRVLAKATLHLKIEMKDGGVMVAPRI